MPQPLKASTADMQMKTYEEETLASTEQTAAIPGERPEVSVFLPVYNEEPNLLPLHAKLDQALKALGRTAEIIYVDDGSTDGSLKVLRELARLDGRIRVVAFKRNYGQTAAMAAGIDAAEGEVLIPMDADLQNDPADIVRLLEKLDEGYDVVSGWRKNRQDKIITRKIPSMLANRLISWIGGVPLHDYGCSLKAYRRESLEDVKLYGEMHRFIPIYASWQGARVTEMVVNHRARRAGRSKYGFSRTFKVLLDLMVVKFLASFATKPIYVFGGFGLLSFACAIGTFLWALYYKLAGLKDFVETPLPLVTVMLTLVGALSLMMGLLAELVIRTYYESQDKRPYLIAEELNRPEKPLPRAVGH